MTLATKITLLRFFLIPVFALLLIYYASPPLEQRDSTLRIAAAIVFLIAAISDGIDGFLARRFNQSSRLGALLDPLADKGLLLTALLLLSWKQMPEEWRLPLWFLILMISRDLMILLGCVILQLLTNNLEIKPSWFGKSATALQMITLLAAMLRPAWMQPNALIPFQALVIVTAVFTALSFILYVAHAIRKLEVA
ncbi:MAG: CDP-diacylglycerol--glycerol-3-phosphate 3-phosphatidyltransferase [Verrucomicrobiae bacterium]|nr:CDP-diacylglycerol--glycerol-3-phosphate 3-phosphatidyltransferase [Verrucomicrobiae bacterium]